MIKRLLLILILLPFFGTAQIVMPLVAAQERDTIIPVVPPPVDPDPANPIILGEYKVTPYAFGGGDKAGVGQSARSPYYVTNLNDSGSGSFRDAVSSSNRDVFIQVSGWRVGGSTISITANNIRIYGQTSPNGFGIHDNVLQISGGDHIAIFSIRVYAGDAKANSGADSFRIIGSNPNDIFVYKSSFKWGDDENVSISMAENESSAARRIGFHECIIAEAFRGGKGLLLYRLNYAISINRCFLAHNKARNIRASTRFTEVEFNNNVIYGAREVFQPTYENKFDFIGNTVKSSNATTRSGTTIAITASTNNAPNGVLANTIAHQADNQENGGAITINSALNPYLQGTRVIALSPVLSRAQALDYVLANAGAVPRDAADAHIIADYSTGAGGLVSNESQTTGLPDLSGGSMPTDADNDNIADAWETAVGGGDINPATKPVNFIINGNTYDNREYTGGEYQDGTFDYIGGTLTGNNLYTWLEIYLADLIGGFAIFEINN